MMEYCDVVHGTFYIPEDISTIINTKVFQRLKNIKQTGLLYKIIATAVHTRYEHCVGTYHLARTLLNSIEKNTALVAQIPALYRKAVEIAALLHDIGHGPFSHSWESICDNYHHEQNALPCIDSIFQSVQGFEDLYHDNGYGIELIKALILGDISFLTRTLDSNYRFIFEIVNNKQCKVDVDKWDYLKRDHHYLSAFLKNKCLINLDFDDLFLDARASDDGAHIQYQYKDYRKIYNLFEARFQFHLHCFRKPIVIVIDKILREIIKNHLHVHIDGKELTNIKADSMAAFLELTDKKVMDMVNACTACKLMVDINNIEIIKENNCKEAIPDYLKVSGVLATAGSVMPSDQEIHFYGSERDMNIIECTRGNYVYESNFRFRSIDASCVNTAKP